MARARLVKPGFFQSDELAQVSFGARLLYAGLWTIADREGRIEDRPLRIKAQVFPYDDVDVNALLNELHGTGMVLRYEADGLRCLCIPTFTKHQKIHHREPASELPPLPEPPPSPYSAPDQPPPSRAEAEGDSTEAEAEAVSVGDRAMSLEAPSPKRVTKDFLERMSVEFPQLDVAAEWEKASNHKAYDKAKDKQRYFQNWLKRALEFQSRDKPPLSKTSNGHQESNILPWTKVIT